jgi:hypothetical protein
MLNRSIMGENVRLISQLPQPKKMGMNLINMTSHLIEQSRD